MDCPCAWLFTNNYNTSSDGGIDPVAEVGKGFTKKNQKVRFLFKPSFYENLSITKTVKCFCLSFSLT